MSEAYGLFLADFILKDRFIGLTTEKLGKALQIVNAQFPGVFELWASLPPPVRDAKRKLCMNYLVGWQMAIDDPDSVINLQGSGGMPIKSKKAGPVSIAYRDVVRQGSGVLDMLTTNEFGMQALMMIQSAPENYVLYR